MILFVCIVRVVVRRSALLLLTIIMMVTRLRCPVVTSRVVMAVINFRTFPKNLLNRKLLGQVRRFETIEYISSHHVVSVNKHVLPDMSNELTIRDARAAGGGHIGSLLVSYSVEVGPDAAASEVLCTGPGVSGCNGG